MKYVATLAIIAVIGLSVWYSLHKPNGRENVGPTAQAQSESYWTCPMHPQIHLDHPGECPICHMKLVLVKKQISSEKSDEMEARAPIQVNALQLQLAGIPKVEVERMTLNVKIPFAGRFISNASVAFQVYESDLRYVRPGLTVRGSSSLSGGSEAIGTISTVDSIVDPTSRTVRVIANLKRTTDSHLAESAFRGDIIIELKNRIAIPESSVLHTGNGDLVYLFTDQNSLKPTLVNLGLKSEGFYDVLGGLNPGQVIAAGPNFLLDSESKIRGAQ